MLKEGIRTWNGRKMVYMKRSYRIVCPQGRASFASLTTDGMAVEQGTYMLCIFPVSDRFPKGLFASDIVTSSEPEGTGVVEYDASLAAWAVSYHKGKKKVPLYLCKNVRVIGNIYENPELLDAKDSSSLIPLQKDTETKLPSTTNIVHLYAESYVAGGRGAYAAILIRNEKIKKKISLFKKANISEMYGKIAAIITALNLLNDPAQVLIHTDDKVITEPILSNALEKWNENNWLNVDGTAIMEQDVWRDLYHVLQIHTVTLAPANEINVAASQKAKALYMQNSPDVARVS